MIVYKSELARACMHAIVQISDMEKRCCQPLEDEAELLEKLHSKIGEYLYRFSLVWAEDDEDLMNDRT